MSFTLSSKEDLSVDSINHGLNSFAVKKKIKKKIDAECDNIESFITFRDSYKLLPAGLKKLCSEFDVDHKKISEVVNFDDVNINNCFGGVLNKNKPLSDELFKIELCNAVYCNYDVWGLLEVLNKFSKSVYGATEINITECITGASLSKKHFFTNFYNKHDYPIWNLDTYNDEFCRAGYYGGRCEAFYIGEIIKKVYYYDFTSLYPDVGRCYLPYGEPIKLRSKVETFNECYKQGHPLPLIKGIVKMRVKTKNFDALPLHAKRIGGKLLFSHFEDWTEITMWYRELLYGVELDIYEYEMIEGVEFGSAIMPQRYRSSTHESGKNWSRETFWKSDGILKEFFEDAVDKKAEAKKNGQPALAQDYC